MGSELYLHPRCHVSMLTNKIVAFVLKNKRPKINYSYIFYSNYGKCGGRHPTATLEGDRRPLR